MSYVEKVLLPGELVRARAVIHWATYLTGLVVLGIATAVYLGGRLQPVLAPALDIVAVALTALGVLLLLSAWFHQAGTEIAVTNHRAIYKSGIFSRRTVEMNMDQIESVEVHQSILGRLLGYGDISLRGTGDGIENIHMVADPLTVRSAITAR
jgi:uncharacterized membrane protein YdbT with pleckstrin-like domain